MSSNITDLLCDLLCEGTQCLETINDFFASVGERVGNNLPNLTFRIHGKEPIVEMTNFKLMSVETFLDIFNEVSYSKSCGIKEIHGFRV